MSWWSSQYWHIQKPRTMWEVGSSLCGSTKSFSQVKNMEYLKPTTKNWHFVLVHVNWRICLWRSPELFMYIHFRCCFKCIFGCCFRCCFKPQTIDQGGNHVIELAIGEKGESNGLFFVKGDMKEAPPQCLDKQNQKDMLRITRNLLIFNR